MIRGAIVSVLASGAIVVAGCADTSRHAATSTTREPAPVTVATTTTIDPAAPFAAGIKQYREDEARRVMQVELENRTDRPLRIDSLQLAWPGLEEAPPTAPGYQAQPGSIVALAVGYGAGVCPAPGERETPTDDAVVRVVATAADGEVVRADVPVTRTPDTLTRVQYRECDTQAVAAAATLALAGPWVATETASGRPALAGSLAVARTLGSDARVTVERIDGAGVLLDFETNPEGQSTVVTLRPDQATAFVPVYLVATGRCDAHALGEDKKTYELYATVRIGDDEHYADLSIPPADRPTVHTVIDRTCGVPTPG